MAVTANNPNIESRLTAFPFAALRQELAIYHDSLPVKPNGDTGCTLAKF
jgi:hypothetical protein